MSDDTRRCRCKGCNGPGNCWCCDEPAIDLPEDSQVSDDTRISEIARRHRPVSVQTGSPWVGICVTCDDPMPCDAAHLLAVNEQQASRIAALEGEGERGWQGE